MPPLTDTAAFEISWKVSKGEPAPEDADHLLPSLNGFSLILVKLSNTPVVGKELVSILLEELELLREEDELLEELDTLLLLEDEVKFRDVTGSIFPIS